MNLAETSGPGEMLVSGTAYRVPVLNHVNTQGVAALAQGWIPLPLQGKRRVLIARSHLLMFVAAIVSLAENSGPGEMPLSGTAYRVPVLNDVNTQGVAALALGWIPLPLQGKRRVFIASSHLLTFVAAIVCMAGGRWDKNVSGPLEWDLTSLGRSKGAGVSRPLSNAMTSYRRSKQATSPFAFRP